MDQYMECCNNIDVVDLLNINWNDTSTWESKEDKCLGKKCFDNNNGFLKHLGLKTQTGWTMKKATKACRQVPNQLMGIHAGDDESYTLFAPMFDELIKMYHKIDVNTNVATKEDYQKTQSIPTLPEGDSIRSTRIRTTRNLAGYPFRGMNNNMTKAQRLEIESILKEVFIGFKDNLKGTYYSMKNMTEDKRKELVDSRYLYTNDDPALQSAGCYNDWPEGRGIFINDKADQSTGVFIIWVGQEDQMKIMAMNDGSDVKAVWELFYSGLEAVHKGVQIKGKEFAFKETHGYLTTCPTNLGTGMRASVHVNLPNFETKQDLEEFVKNKGWPIDVRGAGVGKFYDISNKERMGSDCNEQIKAMVEGVAALLKLV